MNNIIIFPGQGYFDYEALNKEYVKEFCYKYEIDDIFNMVIQEKTNINNTRYAQVLIVAIELAQFFEYIKKNKEEENILVGYSLGEISALIAAGVIDIQEGINFVKARGEISENYQKNILKNSQKYIIGKIPFEENIEKELEQKNFQIINYVPDTNKYKCSILIMGANKDEMISFMRQKRKNEPLENLHISELSCPFHTNLMKDLEKEQIEIFNSKIHKFNKENLYKIVCTKNALRYNELEKEELSKGLSEYLSLPIQTKRTMELLSKAKYKNVNILVTMGNLFINDHLKEQCYVIGLNGNIYDVKDLV